MVTSIAIKVRTLVLCDENVNSSRLDGVPPTMLGVQKQQFMILLPAY